MIVAIYDVALGQDGEINQLLCIPLLEWVQSLTMTEMLNIFKNKAHQIRDNDVEKILLMCLYVCICI